MVTAEIFIGQPSDQNLYPSTLEKYIDKMKGIPPCSVADKGYRSQKNFKAAQHIDYVCFGKLDDVPEEMKEFCKSARSATEGFIAVAKSLRGMGKSLYRGIEGNKIWVGLGQTAYNLKKFYQLYCDEKLQEDTLCRLGFIT
ncbi:MAG: hypothetical protein HQM14_19055 [SAR324 cluster bacterium]|nr:hypothetical protein [SAR324 cluster bacterium]